jgi:D-alanyl-lipoteichoic acid acyltransferase DltB (MBOAT superfamily)
LLFNSYEFIFLFLPVTAGIYFLLSRTHWYFAARCWLLLCSLFFYSWWDARFLPIIMGSIGVNYALGTALSVRSTPALTRRWVLWFGLSANLLLLGYYKYTDFIVVTLNGVFGTHWAEPGLPLPLGISFFTFTQIAFLVDTYRRQAYELRPVNYSLFVSFFPHLLAGPIVHHGQMMPQFEKPRNLSLTIESAFLGSFYFMVGLFQKVVIADYFSPIVNSGFPNASMLTLVEAWGVLLAYGLQIYFDFAGYSNMAIGLARFFNIEFPVNFNSPYQALSIIDFWKRWHMTLSQFLKDYLYIPLGGNRLGEARQYTNIFITMFLGGLWHGAGWTFVLWGTYHGVLIVLDHLMAKWGFRLPHWSAKCTTFILVLYGWVWFRAASIQEAVAMTQALCGQAGVRFQSLPYLQLHQLAPLLAATGLALYFPNTEAWSKKLRPTISWLAVLCCMWMMVSLFLNRASAFLYFQF